MQYDARWSRAVEGCSQIRLASLLHPIEKNTRNGSLNSPPQHHAGRWRYTPGTMAIAAEAAPRELRPSTCYNTYAVLNTTISLPDEQGKTFVQERRVTHHDATSLVASADVAADAARLAAPST